MKNRIWLLVILQLWPSLLVKLLPSFCHITYSGRGSHLRVPCGSIRDRDQNSIRWSKPFLRADQGFMVTSELWKSKDQEHEALIWPLIRKKLSDQAHFLPIKILDPTHKRFSRRHVSDYPLQCQEALGILDRGICTSLIPRPFFFFCSLVCIQWKWKSEGKRGRAGNTYHVKWTQGRGRGGGVLNYKSLS